MMGIWTYRNIKSYKHGVLYRHCRDAGIYYLDVTNSLEVFLHGEEPTETNLDMFIFEYEMSTGMVPLNFEI